MNLLFVLKITTRSSPDVYYNLINCLEKVRDYSDYDVSLKKLQEIVNKQLTDDDMLSLYLTMH